MTRLLVVSARPLDHPTEDPARLGFGEMLAALAVHLPVEVMSLDYDATTGSRRERAPGLVETIVPADGLQRALHKGLRAAGMAWHPDGAFALAGRRWSPAARRVAEAAAGAPAVLVAGAEMAALLPPRRRGQVVIAWSRRVEAGAGRDRMGRGPAAWWMARRAAALERALLRRCTLAAVPSAEHIGRLHWFHGFTAARCVLVPPGLDPAVYTPPPDDAARELARARFHIAPGRRAVLFEAADHWATRLAARRVAFQFAAALPGTDFLIAGQVAASLLGEKLPLNVKLLGWVPLEQRRELLRAVDAAVAPLDEGPLPHAPLRDYLSAGVPVVATHQAAEGLGLAHRREALLLPQDAQAEALAGLLADEPHRAQMAAAARHHATTALGWDRGARALAEAIDQKTGRRLVILNDYPVTPAEQGGQVRIQAVGEALAAAGIRVTLLTLTNGHQQRRTQPAPGFEELNIPTSRLHRRAAGLMERRLGCTATDVAALVYTRWLTPALARELRRELETAAGVMFSHPYLAGMLPLVPRGIPVSFDSHNTEHRLKEHLFAPSALARRVIRRVARAELDCWRRAASVFCVSEENRDDLERLAGAWKERAVVCPNGVDAAGRVVHDEAARQLRRRKAGLGTGTMAIFLGSGHPPNADAARLIIRELAPFHPDVLFVLVGSVNGWFVGQPMPPNVLFMGMVPTEVKDFLLGVADIALNPMLSGSGTSLKMMDYMASGLPVVTTPVGARGMAEEEHQAFVVAEPGAFRAAFAALVADDARRAELGRRARALALARYDWPVALAPMVAMLREDLGA